MIPNKRKRPEPCANTGQSGKPSGSSKLLFCEEIITHVYRNTQVFHGEWKFFLQCADKAVA